MHKKRLLFVIESLRAAGGEKSLVTLLSLIDYDKYSVDLQLLSFGGEFEQFIPFEVNVLHPFKYNKCLAKEGKKDIGFSISKVLYSLLYRVFGKTAKSRARLFWLFFSRYLDKNDNEYDAAIAYGQCFPTFYVVDKTTAREKLGWVNCIYHLDGYERKYQRRFYDALDKIVIVSTQALNHFAKVYPKMADKMYLMPDLINPDIALSMSETGPSFDDGFTGTKILTVARLNKNDKGYDIALNACKILKEKGLSFKWYAIGRGEYKEEMEAFIRENELSDCFILLGTTPNPYPYFKDCTLYVQTSRHEGYGISIAEARLLNRPVVTTDFDSVSFQMIDGKNGLVVSQDPAAVADAIIELINNSSLYNSIVSYQQQEKKGNVEEIASFYKLVEENG